MRLRFMLPLALRGRPVVVVSVLVLALGLTSIGAASAARVDGAVVDTTLVSEAESGGSAGNGASPSDAIITDTKAVLSEDGRFAAFTSDATDLTSDPDTNGEPDVFLWDRVTGEVTLVSTNAMGTGTPGGPSNVRAISGDGTLVVFRSRAADVTTHPDTNENWDLFLWERSTGEVTLISEAASGNSTADDTSYEAAITPDGAWVLFDSYAADLTADTETNHESDLFLWERATGETAVVTRDTRGVAAGGSSGGISDDGRYVAFSSTADDMTSDQDPGGSDAYLWDRETGQTTLISKSKAGADVHPDRSVHATAISADGATVVLAGNAYATDLTEGDDNNAYDVFAWDRIADRLTLVSRSVDGNAGNDGSFFEGQVSSDGSVVVFESRATDLTAATDDNGEIDVFAWTRDTDEVVLVSREQDGSAAGSPTATELGGLRERAALSSNGEFVAFTSTSNTVTSDPDDNATFDVFRWERRTGEIVLVSADQDGNAAGEPGSTGSHVWDVSASGAEVLFSTVATDLTAGEDQPDTVDLFYSEVIGGACPPGEVPSAGFTDISGSVHAPAIDCLAWWEITVGKDDNRYVPAREVTRAQMASFLARLAEAAQVDVPQDPPDRFDDDEGTPHELAINQLAELRVVSGRTETSYDPHASVTRAEMAAFLVRTYELITGETLNSSTDHFTDDEGSGHEDAINAVAEAGFTTGVTETTFEPGQPVTRAQMASFLTRLLDPLVTRGIAPLPN